MLNDTLKHSQLNQSSGWGNTHTHTHTQARTHTHIGTINLKTEIETVQVTRSKFLSSGLAQPFEVTD